MMLFGSSCDYLIVGLGNPGRQYENTRHNVGFRVIDLLCEQRKISCSRLRFKALTSPIVLMGGKKCLLLKPQTFMNLSGEAVFQAGAFYKLPPERIIVLSDDISLPVGRVRVRGDGSAGGHNGLKSIISLLGTQDFPRVKIGVGAKPHPDYDLADWVLSSFSAAEQKELEPALSHAAEAVEELICHGISSAANRYNGK